MREIVFLVLTGCAAFAQTPASYATSMFAFEHASVTASGSANAKDAQIEMSPDSLAIRGMSLKFYIQWAYGLPSFQVEGPVWLKDVGFDIVAKAATPVDEGQLRQMLRTLLAERFGLKGHTEQKEVQVYDLTVSRSSSRLQQSTTDGPPAHSRDKGGAMIAQRVSMAQFAQDLSEPLNHPVFDKTGLKGGYDFRFDTLPYMESAAVRDASGEVDPAEVLAAALRDELGLRLEGRTGNVEFLVVDHVERTPSGN